MIELRSGDKIRFSCTFRHQGAAYGGAKLRCSIGEKRNIWPYDFIERVSKESPTLSFPTDETSKSYTEVVTTDTIKVGGFGGLEEGYYEVLVKLMGIPGADLYWDGPDNDIHAMELGEALFTGLEVSYTKA